jgi:hypothetical protein
LDRLSKCTLPTLTETKAELEGEEEGEVAIEEGIVKVVTTRLLSIDVVKGSMSKLG